jgi:hypothetical protein
MEDEIDESNVSTSKILAEENTDFTPIYSLTRPIYISI